MLRSNQDAARIQLEELTKRYRQAQKKDMPFATLKEIKTKINSLKKIILEEDKSTKGFEGDSFLIN